MRRFLILSVPIAFLLTACGTNRQHVADEKAVRDSSVPRPVYERMVRDEALSLSDIVALSRAGVSDAVIIRYVNHRSYGYYLSRADIDELRREGLSQNLIYTLRGSRSTFEPLNPNESVYPRNSAYGPDGAGGLR